MIAIIECDIVAKVLRHSRRTTRFYSAAHQCSRVSVAVALKRAHILNITKHTHRIKNPATLQHPTDFTKRDTHIQEGSAHANK